MGKIICYYVAASVVSFNLICCVLSICIFSPHFDFVGRILALIVLVSGHCYDFT